MVASGARYRRPEIENLDNFEGRGVWYWASPVEAKLCAGEEVALVGAGNSAGQAAVFLSGHARKVYMIIRGGGLGASMSRYLIERIEATANIELMFNTEISASKANEASLAAHPLEEPPVGRCAVPRYPQSLPVRRRRSRHRLARRLRRHARSRRLCRDRRAVQAERGQSASPLETSVPGVFAVGDVRSGSVKRVGGAIGEGAQVVASLHGFLADAMKPAL